MEAGTQLSLEDSFINADSKLLYGKSINAFQRIPYGAIFLNKPGSNLYIDKFIHEGYLGFNLFAFVEANYIEIKNFEYKIK